MRILERTSVDSLLEGYSSPTLVNTLIRVFTKSRLTSPGEAEIQSWRYSLPALAQVCRDAGLGNIEMLIEVDMPQSDHFRADVVLAGRHPETKQDSYVVVELKQWSSATLLPNGRINVPRLPDSKRHPVDQVREYVALLRQGLQIFNQPGPMIGGVAYLHRAYDNDVLSLYQINRGPDGELFTEEHKNSLVTYLQTRFAPGTRSQAGDRFAHSAMTERLRLMDNAEGEINGIEQFHLVAEQLDAYRVVDAHAEQLRVGDHKAMVIITGGAGTGKTAIGLKLMRRFKDMNLNVRSANGSAAFMTTLRRHVSRVMTDTKKDFLYFSSFRDKAPNQFQVIICDEAHRIREKSTGQGIPPTTKPGRTQLAEIVDAANITVFFLDEHQIIKPDEVGTIDYLLEYAHGRKLKVERVDLRAHFRCGGSERYDQWVHRLMDIDQAGAPAWTDEPGFQVRLVDSPYTLEAVIREHAEAGDRARITAGICWAWNDPDLLKGELPLDIRIGDWEYPWNAKDSRQHCNFPHKDAWATDPRGIDQVGCVYTAQGLEYDWAGVIIGPDLVFKGGRVVPDRSQSKEASLEGCDEDTADRIIRNVYKILLTRGLKGTVIYACDPALQTRLRELINPQQA